MDNRAWSEIEKYAVRNKRRRWSSKSVRRRREANAIAHSIDRKRQEKEQNLNWDKIREILDTKKCTLESAKRRAKRYDSTHK
jgi:hypothetical protein